MSKSTLSILTLLFGWLGSHKFYVRHATLGAIYFYITLIGILLTFYFPIPVSLNWLREGLTFNFGIIVLLLPLVLSFIEFLLVQRYTEGQLEYYYDRTEENQTVVFVAQFVMLFLLLLPLLSRIWL